MGNSRQKILESFDMHRHNLICAQCGYRFVKGDEGFMVHETGDIIHTDCLMDYVQDNIDELTDRIEF